MKITDYGKWTEILLVHVIQRDLKWHYLPGHQPLPTVEQDQVLQGLIESGYKIHYVMWATHEDSLELVSK